MGKIFRDELKATLPLLDTTIHSVTCLFKSKKTLRTITEPLSVIETV